MKPRHLAFVVAFAIAFLPVAAQSEGPTPLSIGAAAPMTDVKMKNVDGRELSIADVRGDKGTLVIFTCNSCPWVLAWEERIVEIGNACSKKGVGVIAINANDPVRKPDDDFGPMQTRANERGMDFPYVMDATSGVARAFGASRTPEVFLFDASGKLVYHGTIDDNARDEEAVTKRYLVDAIEAMLAGGKIDPDRTKALGCTIKFRS